jgi:DNA repair protein RecO (recombination protein O)
MPPKHIDLQRCYVLHTRPYRDTSLLVDILSQQYGKLTLIARGARKTSKSTQNPRYLLQPFIPLSLSWQGKSSLKTLTTMEAAAPSISLVGNRLYSAMYANELLTYLLQEDDDPSEDIYLDYEVLLQRLSDTQYSIEAALRQFEFTLLAALGYEINFTHDAYNQQPLDASASYYYIQEQGFVAVEEHPDIRDRSFNGEALLYIAANHYDSLDTRRVAKQVARIALSPHLRNRPLKSKELFLGVK